MAIIIPHQLSLAPPPVPPPVFSGPLPNPQRSAFLFPSVRFFVSSNLLSRPLRSASSFPLFHFFVPFGPLFRSLCFAPSFPLFRSFVPFVSLLRFFRSALSFSSVRFLVSFGLLFRFLRSVSCFFWSVSTRHCLVASPFPFSSSLPFCQLFSLLSNPTHVFQRSRPCPSTFEITPFLPQEHALQRSRTRPSSCVSVCV